MALAQPNGSLVVVNEQMLLPCPTLTVVYPMKKCLLMKNSERERWRRSMEGKVPETYLNSAKVSS